MSVWETGDRYAIGAEFANVMTHVIWRQDTGATVASWMNVGADKSIARSECVRLARIARGSLRQNSIRCACTYCKRLEDFYQKTKEIPL